MQYCVPRSTLTRPVQHLDPTVRLLSSVCVRRIIYAYTYWPFASWEAQTGMRGDGWRHAVRQRKRYTPQSKILWYYPFCKKWLSSQYFYSANVYFQQLYVFAMNNKAFPTPSTNLTKKCRTLFPCCPSLESRLAGGHTVSMALWRGRRL
jgi:hypothetical protein